MKKHIITGVLLAVLFSCQTENKVIVSQEQLQTQEMKDFNEAFRNLGKPQNKATEQERKSMKNILLLIISMMVNSLLFSQQPFEFERTWGTYFGPAGTQIAGIYHQKGILFDSQKNKYVRGSMWNYSNFPASYFNQFLLGGGTSITNPPQHNRFEAAVSAQGTPFFFGFYPYVSGNRLETIDS